MVDEPEITKLFLSLCAELRDKLMRMPSGTAAHPSGMIAEYDYSQTVLFSVFSEIFDSDVMRLRFIDDHSLPYRWMIKDWRVRNGDESSWHRVRVLFELNEMLGDEARESEAHEALAALQYMKTIGITQWLSECQKSES
jgi:hypothetical protein